MPTRKQRRRAAKEKRHEYETVWVDAEGNELDEPPEGASEAGPDQRAGRDGKASRTATKSRTPTQRGGRGAARTPPEPSWQRAGKRALILGAVVFALFYLTGGGGGSRLPAAFGLAALYTVLFIPLTYTIDRFAYQRWQRRQEGGGKPPPRKR